MKFINRLDHREDSNRDDQKDCCRRYCSSKLALRLSAGNNTAEKPDRNTSRDSTFDHATILTQIVRTGNGSSQLPPPGQSRLYAKEKAPVKLQNTILSWTI